MENKEQLKLIDETLDKIRPFIQRDGGDVTLVGFKDGIVYIKMLGACQGCTLIDSTVSDGIQIILMEEVPGVLGVQVVDSENEIPGYEAPVTNEEQK